MERFTVEIKHAQEIGQDLITYTKLGNPVMLVNGLFMGSVILDQGSFMWALSTYVVTGLYYTYCRKLNAKWAMLNVGRGRKTRKEF